MSATAYVSAGNGKQSGRARHSCRTRWRALEIVAIVLGFIIWWPIGLGLLMWKLWRARSGRPSDLVEAARNLEENMMYKWPETARRWGCASRRRAEEAMPAGWGFAAPGRSTGNAAFDEWRDAELARLEEERRKLEDAAREFSDYVENLRKAKDREEFNAFMQERSTKGRKGPPGSEDGASAN